MTTSTSLLPPCARQLRGDPMLSRYDVVVVDEVQVVEVVLLEPLIVVVAAAVFQTLTAAAVVLVELDLFLSDTQHKYLKNRNVFYKGRI